MSKSHDEKVSREVAKMLAREKVFFVRKTLPAEEHQILVDKAKQSGLTVAAYVRSVMLGKK